MDVHPLCITKHDMIVHSLWTLLIQSHITSPVVVQIQDGCYGDRLKDVSKVDKLTVGQLYWFQVIVSLVGWLVGWFGWFGHVSKTVCTQNIKNWIMPIMMPPSDTRFPSTCCSVRLQRSQRIRNELAVRSSEPALRMLKFQNFPLRFTPVFFGWNISHNPGG